MIVTLSHKTKNDMKKNTNTTQVIATTPMQSLLLTLAGLPESTADMRWNRRATICGQMILEPLAPSEPPIRYEGLSEHPADYIPAWSLGALIRISGVNLCTSDPVKLREYLVDAICQQLENGGE